MRRLRSDMVHWFSSVVTRGSLAGVERDRFLQDLLAISPDWPAEAYVVYYIPRRRARKPPKFRKNHTRRKSRRINDFASPFTPLNGRQARICSIAGTSTEPTASGSAAH